MHFHLYLLIHQQRYQIHNKYLFNLQLLQYLVPFLSLGILLQTHEIFHLPLYQRNTQYVIEKCLDLLFLSKQFLLYYYQMNKSHKLQLNNQKIDRLFFYNNNRTTTYLQIASSLKPWSDDQKYFLMLLMKPLLFLIHDLHMLQPSGKVS